MTFQIIIKGKEESRKRLKGKSVTELAKNMESQGWPTEFASEEHRDRIKHEERRNERPLQRQDSVKVAKEMGFDQRRRIAEIAHEKDCGFWPIGQPEPD